MQMTERKIIVVVFFLAVPLSFVLGGVGDVTSGREIGDILGVTHARGRYCFGQQDFQNEGADRILGLGSRVIKVWFTKPADSYPFNSDWPETNSLVEIAKTPYFRTLFDKPFTTFILMAFSMHRSAAYFRNGVPDEQKRDEQEQFYQLAAHLLKTYRNTDKTFILQHWEGDWLIRGNYNPNDDPTPTAIAGMIDWLNARQAGVNQARKEFGSEGVRVYHAAEVNLVVKSMNENKPNLVNRVLPHTHVDLVSYSAWDAIEASSRKPDVFKKTLDYIAAHIPDSAAFGAKNVYVGEFGVPANRFSPAEIDRRLNNTTRTALAWGCPYIVYWQLYCNELAAKDAAVPVSKNDDVKGFWLVKPDGTYGRAWDFFHKMLN